MSLNLDNTYSSNLLFCDARAGLIKLCLKVNVCFFDKWSLINEDLYGEGKQIFLSNEFVISVQPDYLIEIKFDVLILVAVRLN